MKTTQFIPFLILLLVIIGLFTYTYAADRNRGYDVVVGPQKSDTVRMVEAYERLTDQYLRLVQNNLAMMAQHDRDILDKLDKLEQKVDYLTQKMEALDKSNSQALPVKQDTVIPDNN